MTMSGARRLTGALAVLLVLAGAAACTGSGNGAAGLGAGDGGGAGRRVEPAPGKRSGEALALRADNQALRADSQAAPTAAPLPRLGPSIIKTADVQVSVPQADVQESVQLATDVAGRFGGFVHSTSVESQGTHRGTVILRVPSTRFEEALRELRGLGRVRQENISGVDVTQEFIDLQARLRNWQAQEAVLLRLMDRARSVTDTIRVQGELARVQLEIERLRGRLNYLEDQTDLATITATFVGAGPAPAQPTTLARAWREAVEASLQVVAGVIVATGYVVPVGILVMLAALALRGLRPRFTPRA
jgi:hypothetical protein